MLSVVCFRALAMAAADDKMEIDDSLYRLMFTSLLVCSVSVRDERQN